MVGSCCTGGQAGQARSLRQQIERIAEKYEKVEKILGEEGVSLSLPGLSWLIKRLARRCWLEQDKRTVPERLLNSYVCLEAYVLMAVTGLGYLALTWSMVVLLGGFVTLLGKKDFWCLTIISSIQAAKMFDTLQDDMVFYLLRAMIWIIIRWDQATVLMRSILSLLTAQRRRPMSVREFFYTILMMPVSLVTQLVLSLYVLAPFVGIVLSAWRLRRRDYGTSNDSGDNSKANLTPALDIYYALVLLQGTFYLLWCFNNIVGEEIVRSVYRQCKLNPKWGKNFVSEYLRDTRRSYAKEPASLEDRNLIAYAVGLLESESRKEYMSGARLLTTFIKEGKDVRSLLLLSRPKIQKLIDTLGWRGIRGDESQEIRLLVAKIVADVAGNIHLVQFPGAAQCIASLFAEGEDELPPQENLPVVVTSSGRTGEGRKRSHEEGNQEGDTYNENELILQGLTILERLASNQHNCRDICSTPGLLSVITAPIYSDTLIKDIEVSACAEVAYRSFKVVHQLITRTPGETLRRKISSSNQAVSNLEKILDPDTRASQILQMGAMEILTELTLDLPINPADKTKENLRHDIADRLTEIMFDGNTNIMYKIRAAEILVNLCTHSTLPEERVKGKLLPKLLTRVLSSNVERQQESSRRNIWNCCPGICGSAPQGEDVENQPPNHNIQNQQRAQENEEQILTNKLLETSLSLILLIYGKMISDDGFDSVLQEIAPAGQLMARLKTIVEENCKATSVSLRIVKLCGQIAMSMMQRQPNKYTAHFKDRLFVESLSKASGMLSNLDSCMLVTATNNCRMRKNGRPLLSHLEKGVRDLITRV